MKREKYEKPSFLKTCKRILVATMALSMTLSGNAWAGMNKVFEDGTSKITATYEPYAPGDVTGDGEIKLGDAQVVLRAALNIVDLNSEEFKAADVNFDGEIKLNDAQMILRIVLNIIDAPTSPPESETPESSTPTPTPTPTATVKPSIPTARPYPSALPEVMADPENVVYNDGEVEVKSYQGASLSESTGLIKFNEQEKGLLMQNPFAGDSSLLKTAEEMTDTTPRKDGEVEKGELAPDGQKWNIWELLGASFKEQLYPDDYDRRVIYEYKPDEVDYTVPEWDGVTVNFWLKCESTTKGNPAVVFENGDFMLLIRMNGTIEFQDGTDAHNSLSNSSTVIEPWGKYGEWTYYTVTIANDWVQVYINGQENLFESLNLKRSDFQNFNNGFLSRYNPIGDVTQEDVDADPRGYLQKMGAWYWNSEHEAWMSYDKYGVFYNGRFRGSNCKSEKYIVNMIADEETNMWIGGTKTDVATSLTTHKYPAGTMVTGITVHTQELTPEQISANYTYQALPGKPEVEKAEDVPDWVEPTDAPPTERPDVTEDPNGGTPALVSNLYQSAAYDEETNVITFKEPAGTAGNIRGVRMENPFAEATELRETIEDALVGQEIFPYKDKNGFTYDSTAKVGYGGWDRKAVQPMRGNFYDVYYGDYYLYGNEMDPPTGLNTFKDDQGNVLSSDKIMTLAKVKDTYGDKVTEFHRPEWQKGASVSFWAKPVEVDDSPLLTFFRSQNMILYVDVMGNIGYYSLIYTASGQSDTDWNKQIASNGEPKNTFATLGDASMVKANEWNYYTVTIANDWIQVYVNGEEMVYEYVNSNRTEQKNFNKGYMTRYSTVGIWTTDMLAELGDPSGTTLEGKERNYLTKTGFLWDPSTGLTEGGAGPDDGCIRANNTYEKPLGSGTTLLMDHFTKDGAWMVIGGMSTALDNGKYTFSEIKVKEDTDPELVNYMPYFVNELTGEDDPSCYKKIYSAAHTLDAGTQVADVRTYMKELTAEDVKDCYEYALAETKPSDAAAE